MLRENLPKLLKFIPNFIIPGQPSSPPSARISSEFVAEMPTADLVMANSVTLRDGWDARPRYQADEEEEGIFVGRQELLDRLTSDFTSRRSGTILISGVRGVGKTALVEKALVEARRKLAKRYWKQAALALEQTPFWRLIRRSSREVLYEVARKLGKPAKDYLAMRDAAALLYLRRPVRWIWQRRNPVTQFLRRLHEASRAQILVLKFNASDIGGALADPEEVITSGKPNVNPEKLLRALIRKVHAVCHQTRSTPEARILCWSLERKLRNRFFQILQAAYDKSVSKSYKETISNKLSEAIKRSQVTTSELKINIERILGIVVCLGIGAGAYWLGIARGWNPLWAFVSGGGATAAAYFTFTRTSKWVRESSSSRNRDAQFSYEYDYSLARMEYDLEEILGVLRQPKNGPFNPYRCFTRKIIIFDELDKLENPIQQLNDVITHFKNFFTLSDALFVFITDHEFYEHLSIEGTKAQLRRHYSPEHTFFTQKVYLRKPEFNHFNQTIFRFCETKALQRRVQTGSLDTDLIKYLAEKEPTTFSGLSQWSNLDTLRYLYVHGKEYQGVDLAQVEKAFERAGGRSDPLALAEMWIAEIANRELDEKKQAEREQAIQSSRNRTRALAIAQIWAATVAAGKDGSEWKTRFRVAGGWQDAEAVAYLYQRQSRFSDSDRNSIIRCYEHFSEEEIRKYSSVDESPFTLTDLARTICFQTRNHYFDLYYLIYDYVGSYVDGLPVLHLEPERFTREHRLWSRYQQMVQLAFYYRHEDHPSREYFNALLMESLYGVFDTRGWGGAVKLEEILFSPEKIAASLQQTPARQTPKTNNKRPGKATKGASAAQPSRAETKPDDQPSPNGRLASTVTARDAELINQALLRLLRIAIARKAIKVSEDFKNRLKDSELKLKEIAHLTFEWEPDCEPTITQEGLDLEKYERELIRLWKEHQIEIEALEDELSNAWGYLEIPADSLVRKVRNLFTQLRTTADGLASRSKTISNHDAAKLRADLGSPNTWIPKTLDLLIERLRADGAVGIVEGAALKGRPKEAGSLGKSPWENSLVEIENIVGPVAYVMFFSGADTVICFVAGAIPADLDVAAAEAALRKRDSYLFWYAPDRDADLIGQFTTVQPEPKVVQFYLSPPASNTISNLLADYGAIASRANLQGVQNISSDGGYQQNAVLEAISPLTGMIELTNLLGQSQVQVALKYFDGLPDSFKAGAEAFWGSYGIVFTQWSFDDAINKIADKVLPPSEPKSPTLKAAIENALRQGLKKDVSKVGSSPLLTATDPQANSRSLIREIIASFIDDKLKAAKIEDQKFSLSVRKDFTDWLFNTIEGMAKEKKISLTDFLPSLTNFIGELDKHRTAAKSTPTRT